MAYQVPVKQPLPVHNFNMPTHSAAYRKCLEAEGTVRVERDLVFIRCLGYLLIEAPFNEGRHQIARDISGCGDLEDMKQLGKMVVDHLIRLSESTFNVYMVP
jgi:hypothetical protein